jgi:hypothetical protein
MSYNLRTRHKNSNQKYVLTLFTNMDEQLKQSQLEISSFPLDYFDRQGLM